MKIQKLLTFMLIFSCIAMMYGKIFVKPDQYHFVQERGYLNEKDYTAYNRAFIAKDLADSFNEQLDLWYNKANEDIFSDNIKKAIDNEINENVKDRKDIDDRNAHPIDSVIRSTHGLYNLRFAEPMVRS